MDEWMDGWMDGYCSSPPFCLRTCYFFVAGSSFFFQCWMIIYIYILYLKPKWDPAVLIGISALLKGGLG